MTFVQKIKGSTAVELPCGCVAIWGSYPTLNDGVWGKRVVPCLVRRCRLMRELAENRGRAPAALVDNAKIKHITGMMEDWQRDVGKRYEDPQGDQSRTGSRDGAEGDRQGDGAAGV